MLKNDVLQITKELENSELGNLLNKVKAELFLQNKSEKKDRRK